MKSSRLVPVICVSAFVLASEAAEDDGRPEPKGERYPGVIAKVYNEPDFTRIKRCLEPQDSLETYFDDGQGHGIDWSGVWEGYLISPVAGTLTLHLRAWKPTTLDLYDRGRVVTNGKTGVPVVRSITVEAREGEPIPFKITYIHAKGGRGGWQVRWSTDGKPEPIPAEALFIDQALADDYHWSPEPDPESVDFSRFASVDQENVIVAYEPGRAFGWPANQGFFSWDDEILLTFHKGYSLERGLNHAIDPTRGSDRVQVRSLDGGLTWREETSEPVPPTEDEAGSLPSELDFQNPGFALQTYGGQFRYTLDRGKNWRGPFRWPDTHLGAYTNRTDYLSIRPGYAVLGFSVKDPEMRPEYFPTDHTYFVEFDQNAGTIEFLGWLTPPSDPDRAVMPNTVRISSDHLITAARRKHELHERERPPLSRNWIEAFESVDAGRTWKSLGEIAETDHGRFNGNPPSLVHLGGTRLAAVYGFRGIPYSIRARVSPDLGQTWNPEILLRRDPLNWDVGYVRSALRSDGRVVSVYYLKTKERTELHFEGTIWDPDTLRLPR